MSRTGYSKLERAEWIHLSEDEEIYWAGRSTLFTIARPLASASILIVIGVVLTLVGPTVLANWLDVTVSGWVRLLPLLVAVWGCFVGGQAYLGWRRTQYVITNQEVYIKEGFVSRDVSQIRLDRVQNTTTTQSAFERILSYGDIVLYTSGSDTLNIVLDNVPDPQQVNGIITRLLETSVRGDRNF